MITFDPVKRDTTLRERGIDFAVDAEKVFSEQHATAVSDRDHGELRFKTVGRLNRRMVVVIWTKRGADRHVISMRFCHAKEERVLSRQFNV